MQASSPRPSDRFLPWYIVAFFTFFMLVLSGFAWIAVHSYTGEITREPYKKGLAYNTDIAKAEAQAKLGWKGKLQVSGESRMAHIVFTLNDSAGRSISDAQAKVLCLRPTQAGNDAELTLAPDGKGGYFGDVALAWPGQWEVRVSAMAQGHNFQQMKTVLLQ